MDRNVVGARELKTRLGTYLRRVRAGRTVLVTDRGLPIAELRPVASAGSVDAALAKLRALGAVSGTGEGQLEPFQEIRSTGGTLAHAIVEEREDRF